MIDALFKFLGVANWSRVEIILITAVALLIVVVVVMGRSIVDFISARRLKSEDDERKASQMIIDKEEQIADITAKVGAKMTERHQLCEWRIMKITDAMVLYVKANKGGKRSTKSGEATARRKTDNLVSDMLQAALRGPQSDAERAEVRTMQV